MKILRSWLADYVDFTDLSTHDFSELITTRVAEVGECHTLQSPVDQAIVAAVIAVAPHPEREKLKIARVSTGSEEVQVICGAANCREGELVAFLPPGSTMLSASDAEKKILVESRDMGGVASHGVLCSEAELGLSSNHQGLLLLTKEFLAQARAAGGATTKVAPGTTLASLIDGADVALEIDNKSLTHRPDLWSHFGFARELAAILGRPLKDDPDLWADTSESGRALLEKLGSGTQKLEIQIMPGSECRRFTAILLEGLKTEPSPFWMKRRLFSVGAGVRNFLVDLSNYVMHDIGQPNHAYDADRLAGLYLEARRARAEEKFKGLDGLEYTLSNEDVVIADRKEAVALAGVMGGLDTAVADDTTRLVLEAANFDPVRVRRTSKRQQLRTDASNRFEKSLSAYNVPLAIQRFAQLVAKVQPGAVIGSGLGEAFPEKPQKVTVPLRISYITERLGAALPDAQVMGILQSLGFREEEGATGKQLVVPYYRATRDISIEDDLVEEVGRIFGYENVPEEAPKIESNAAASRQIGEFEHELKASLSGQGFVEIYNYTFMGGTAAEALGYPLGMAIEVENPVDTTLNFMRTTLVPGLVATLEKNARFFSRQLLFEIGRAYDARPESSVAERPLLPATFKKAPAYERRLLSIIYSSGADESGLSATVAPPLQSGADFYALRTVIERLVFLAGGCELIAEPIVAEDTTAEADDFTAYRPWMHPFRAAVLKAHGKVVGHIAELHPSTCADVKSRAVVAELDLEKLLEAGLGTRTFKQLARFPFSFFEMSVVVPEETQYRTLEQLITSNIAVDVFRGLEVIAVYQGKPIEQGHKSVSVRVSFGAEDRTLSGEELTALQDGLMSVIDNSAYSLRR